MEVSHCDFTCLITKIWNISCMSVMLYRTMLSLFLSHLPVHHYGRQECQMSPTNMVIIFKLMRFEIMTSFICLFPSNKKHWPCLVHLLLDVSLQQYCTYSCMSACMYALECSAHHMWDCSHLIPRAESERQRPLMFCSSLFFFFGNFIVNGAQLCTCLQAIQRFGISLSLCAWSCVPLMVCLVCACFGYVKRKAIFFNH